MEHAEITGKYTKNKTCLKNYIDPDILLQVSEISIFSSLLHTGVFVEICENSSIKDLLCGELQINASYLKEQIQTIFLNFRPVDNPESAVIGDGSVISLSAAMPGIMGALLRKEGRYAPMRQQISYHTDMSNSGDKTEKKGRVLLKVFNMLAPDLCESILGHGVFITCGNLRSFLDKYRDTLPDCITALFIDRKKNDIASLFYSDFRAKEVFLKVQPIRVSFASRKSRKSMNIAGTGFGL